LTPNGSSVSSQVPRSVAPTTDALNTISSDRERLQHFRAHVSPPQVSDIHSSSLLESNYSELYVVFCPFN